MCAIGVGGADAVDVMAGIPWELKAPKVRHHTSPHLTFTCHSLLLMDQQYSPLPSACLFVVCCVACGVCR
jgi:hypothetical protein